MSPEASPILVVISCHCVLESVNATITSASEYWSPLLAPVMDSSELRCYCGKLFHQLNAFSNHQGHCKSSQERLSLALSKAQQIWNKKRAEKRLRTLRVDANDYGSSEAEKAGQSSSMMNPQTSVDAPQNASPEPEQDDRITLEETVSLSYFFFGPSSKLWLLQVSGN